MAHGLSKSRLMSYRQCPRRLWLSVHRKDLETWSDDAAERFEIGFQVGEVARSLYPDGILIGTADVAEALAETRRVLAAHPQVPVFEAAFERDGVAVRVDLLLPGSGAYLLREVKASTQVYPHHREDCAIQHWVASACVPLCGAEVAHVDRDFVYPGGGDYRGLFKAVALDSELAALTPEVSVWVAGARQTLAGAEPAIEPGPHCHQPYACPFLDHCKAGRTEPDYPLGALPRLTGWRREGLEALGIEDVRQIPDDYELTENQARIAQVIKSGVAELDPRAADLLRPLPYPRYYLDFESMQLAVPLWAGTRPYQQLPVQWSCHVEAAPGELRDVAFLADGESDPRRALAQALIATLGEQGPVFVYSRSFEAARLRELADAFPDLAGGLSNVIERIVDLKPIAARHYCHPDMKGSWSLKAVLPTIAPELDYAVLALGDGGEASSAWREIYHPETPPSRRSELKAALAAYCARDTLAMVRLAAFLSGMDRDHPGSLAS